MKLLDLIGNIVLYSTAGAAWLAMVFSGSMVFLNDFKISKWKRIALSAFLSVWITALAFKLASEFARPV